MKHKTGSPAIPSSASVNPRVSGARRVKAAVRDPRIAKRAGGLRAAEIAVTLSDATNGDVKRDRNGLVRCRVCGCTAIDACSNSCSWVEFDLCSTCAEAKEALLDWSEHARRANWTALRKELRGNAGAQNG